ncbi:TolB family protein, partial [Enterococcus faecium]|uniref:TolB family protein n=1 Tax=Enterococcus faecium TaxID=1352 RepID=UPI0025B35383
CVRERHAGGTVTRALVAVPLDGSAALPGSTGVRELVSGSDFLAFPRLSPDGRTLAWVAWDHPRMPWDGTELRVARVDVGLVGSPRTRLGGPSESVLQPLWLDDATLAVMSARSGWWNLVRAGLDGTVEPLVEVE